ncbi:MAG: response regulator [Deltaproteobacteria bacterium]|nr:response regulator [Deltaproteobacteria bacterium]
MSDIKVLLVDDEVGFTAGMKKVLSNRGFCVKEARDGLTALSMIAADTFDVVVLDIKMPGMDGNQVFKEISRLSPNVPVIVLTGHYALVEEEDALEKGAYAYLLKPCPIMELVAVIEAAGSKK